MAQTFTIDNIDPTTLDEVSQLQRAAGERWTGREIAAYRVARLTEREKFERAAKIKRETKPVKMYNSNDQKWARKLENVQDSQVSRTQERAYQASKERKEFETEKAKWDKQSESVLGDLKRQGYLK